MASKKVFVASFYTNIDAVTQIKMQFKTLPDLPESLFYHQSALIKDAKGDTNLLVFGGLSAFGNYEGQESRNQVHSFNLQAEFKAQANFESFYDNRTKTNWVERAPMNEKRAGFSSVVTQSQLLYVFGGHNQGKLASIAIERFNINQNIWTPIPLKIDDQDFTSLIGAAMTTDPANEKVYILGGSDGQVLQSSVFELDTRSAQLRALSTMLDARTNTQATFHNGKVFIFVGLGSSGENHCLDLATNEWKDLERKFESLTSSQDLDLHNNPGCFV